MSHPFGELSAQREHLGDVLRRLRMDAGLSGEQIAERAGISQSRASRIELGQQSVPSAVVERWAKASEASETALAEVMELAEAASTLAISWRRTAARGLVKLQQDSRDLEASATVFLSFQLAVIPGLLQIAEYSRRVFAAGYPPPGHGEVTAAAAVRMERQAILYDEARRFDFILGEAALRWRLGPPPLMRAQLSHIGAMSGLSNVTVGVIPLSTGADVWHEHSFDLLDGRGDAGDAVVHIETLTTGLTLTEPDDIAAYRDVFGRLRDVAVTGEDAQRLIAAIAAEL